MGGLKPPLPPLYLCPCYPPPYTHDKTLSPQVVEEVDAYTLTPNNALHIKANCNFTDQFGRGRRIGEEWLVKYDDTESYIPDVTEVSKHLMIINTSHTFITYLLSQQLVLVTSNKNYLIQCVSECYIRSILGYTVCDTTFCILHWSLLIMLWQYLLHDLYNACNVALKRSPKSTKINLYSSIFCRRLSMRSS